MSELRSIGFVVNPNAGRQKSHIWKQEIDSALRESGKDHEISETKDLESVENEVRRLSEAHDAVFAVGGDGTAHHVAQGLANSRTLFGLLPNGSGNDYSRQIGMPRGVRIGLEMVLKGYLITERNAIEVIVIEEDSETPIKRWGINTVGFGFDASVSHLKTKVPVLKGLPLYLTSSVASLMTYRPTLMTGGKSGNEQFQGLMIAAGVGEFEGGGFRIFPGAANSSGEFHICEVRENSMLRALPLLIRAVNGKHVTSPRVEMRTGTQATWKSDKGVPVHADGEVISRKATEVTVRLVKKALRVITPQN